MSFIDLKMCVVCMTRNNTEVLVKHERNGDIFKKFSYVTGISQSIDFPTILCKKCTVRLSRCFDFKQLSVKSNLKLIALFEKINRDLAEIEPNQTDTIYESDEEDEQASEYEDKKPTRRLISQNDSECYQLEVDQNYHLQRKTENALPDVELKDTAEDEYQEDTKAMYLVDDNDEQYDIMDIAEEEDPTEDQYESIEAEDDEFILMDLKVNDPDEVSSMLSGGNQDESYREIFVEDRMSDEDDKTTLVMLPSAKNVKPSRTLNNSSQSHEKQYCQKCEKAFSTKTNLVRHMQSHDGKKPYICKVCCKGFTQSGSLKQHMYLHTGERPFECTVCDRKFSQAKTLTFHLRIHNNEKPFECLQCNQHFRQKDGLKRHTKVKHGVDYVTPTKDYGLKGENLEKKCNAENTNDS